VPPINRLLDSTRTANSGSTMCHRDSTLVLNPDESRVKYEHTGTTVSLHLISESSCHPPVIILIIELVVSTRLLDGSSTLHRLPKGLSTSHWCVGGMNLTIARFMHGDFQVYVRQDTPPVEEFIWSMPRPSSGRLHPPIPPRFEPVLYMPPTLTGLETPSAMPTPLSPAPKLANSLSFARVLRTGGVDHTTVGFDYTKHFSVYAFDGVRIVYLVILRRQQR
jgi:hypothetical protein